MEKVKIHVIEDELITGSLICDYMNEAGYLTVGPDISYAEAKKTFELESPDILITDVFLFGGLDGIDFAEYVKSKVNIPIIFITSTTRKDILERAKKISPAAYLCKPFNIHSLCSCVEVALDNFSKNITIGSDEIKKVKDAFFLKSGSIFKKVQLTDILYIKSDSVYNIIYTKSGGEFLFRGKIKEFAKCFAESLIQIHRSIAVNYKHISSIDEGGVYIEGQFLPVSQSYKKNLMDLFLTF